MKEPSQYYQALMSSNTARTDEPIWDSRNSDEPEDEPLKLARFFHDTYERLAPEYEYQTRKETRDFDPKTPNGKLMIAVAGEVLKKFLRCQD